MAKVRDDIENVNKMLEQLDSKTRAAAKDNLKAISKDVNRYSHGEHTPALKQAIQNRIKALKLMAAPARDQEEEEEESENDVAENQIPSFEEEAEARVVQDIAKVRQAVHSSKLAGEEKHRAMRNLQKLEEDAQKYPRATSKTSKLLIGDAMHIRMEELKQQLNNAHAASSSTPKVGKIEQDVHNVERALEGEDVSKAVRDNLKSIAHDAEELQHAHGARHAQLVKAMKLRTKALKQQLKDQ